MPRVALVDPTPKDRQFISSGALMLDLVLGGGWGVGRIINIVGDRSSGKTLLAIEFCANLIRLTPAKFIRYCEAESAFDDAYAQTIGMPQEVQRIDGLETVEAVFNDLNEFLDKTCDGKSPAAYIIDSLDALSDEAEMKREFGEGTYGASKAKQMSQLFRRLVRKLGEKKCTLVVISQIRDKMNVAFGETKTRSGGRALDFYASQIVWLAETGRIYRDVLRQRRVAGIKVLARCRKNKLGVAHRDCELDILFNYGVDDEESMLTFISRCGIDGKMGKPVTAMRRELKLVREARDHKTLRQIRRQLREIVVAHWDKIEQALEPPMRKYRT